MMEQWGHLHDGDDAEEDAEPVQSEEEDAGSDDELATPRTNFEEAPVRAGNLSAGNLSPLHRTVLPAARSPGSCLTTASQG